MMEWYDWTFITVVALIIIGVGIAIRRPKNRA